VLRLVRGENGWDRAPGEPGSKVRVSLRTVAARPCAGARPAGGRGAEGDGAVPSRSTESDGRGARGFAVVWEQLDGKHPVPAWRRRPRAYLLIIVTERIRSRRSGTSNLPTSSSSGSRSGPSPASRRRVASRRRSSALRSRPPRVQAVQAYEERRRAAGREKVKPVLLVVAGPNGAGKTTVTERLRKESWSEGVEYIIRTRSPEDRFGDWNSPDAVLRCGELGFDSQGAAPRSGERHRVRDVLSAPERSSSWSELAAEATYPPLLHQYEQPRDQRAVALRRGSWRAATRAIEKIITGTRGSMANLTVAAQIADRAYVYDNSSRNAEARLCLRTEAGLLRKVYGPMPQWVEDAVGSMASSIRRDLR